MHQRYCESIYEKPRETNANHYISRRRCPIDTEYVVIRSSATENSIAPAFVTEERRPGNTSAMNWNWDHLRYFLALAKAGSLSQAARDLNVSHTTVLRRVKAIENELETHLFDHTSQGHKLTSAGESLYAEVNKMERAVNDIARKISGIDQEIKGPVSITTTDTLGFFVMPGIITQLQTQYPQLQVSLIAANKMSDIDNREADIALRTCLEPPDNLVGRRLGSFSFYACASRSYIDKHALTRFPDNTAKHHFIVLDESFDRAPFSQWLYGRLHEDSQRTIANGMLTAYRLCEAGAGIAVLPDYLFNQNGSLVPLPHSTHRSSECIFNNDLWLLSHIDLRQTARIRLVKNFLFEQLQPMFSQ